MGVITDVTSISSSGNIEECIEEINEKSGLNLKKISNGRKAGGTKVHTTDCYAASYCSNQGILYKSKDLTIV